MTPDPAYAPPSGIAPTDPIGTSVQAGGSSTTVSRGELSPRQEGNLTGQREATLVEQDNLNRQTGEDIQKARINEKLAAAQNQLDANVSWQKQETLRAHAASLEESRGRYRASIVDREKAVEAGNRDYWTDQGAARQFFGGLFIALGHLGSGLMQIGTGHPSENTALRIIEGAINRDSARKRLAIDAANDKVLMLRQGVADSRDARHDALQDIDVDRAARWGYVKSYFEKQLAARGEPLAQIAGDARIIKAQQEMDKAEAKILETQAKKIATTTFGRHETKTESGKADPMGGTIYGPGGKPLARIGDPKKATEANKAISNAREIRAGLAELRASYDKHGFEMPKASQEYERRASIHARVLTLMKEEENLGVLAGPDMGIMQGQIGGTYENVTGRGQSKLDQATEMLDRKMAGYLDSLGVSGETVAPAAIQTPAKGHTPAKAAPAKAAAPAAGSDDEGRRLMNDESIPWAKRLEIMKELGSGRR